MAPSKAVVAAGPDAVAPIDPDQTLKASKALLAHIKKAAKESADGAQKRNLLADDDDDDDDTPVWLTLTTKRHMTDKSRLQPGKIALPHPLNAGEATTICAITADPQRAYKDLVASDGFPAELRGRITRVIGYSKLRAKYSQYEAQRKLFSEHDVFVADDRIVNRLPKVLGKTFYKTTQKRPIPVVLRPRRPARADAKRGRRPDADADADVNAASAADMAREVQKALSSALVSLAPTTSTAVRIGYAHWPPEHVAANADAVAAALVDKWVPHKWRGVKTIHIKGPRTAALPIWMTDELWVDDKDVMPDADADGAADEAKATAEKANIGKKRKSLGEPDAPAAKKTKRAKKQPQEKPPAGDDEQLDKQIAQRKAKLKKQKAAATKAMD